MFVLKIVLSFRCSDSYCRNSLRAMITSVSQHSSAARLRIVVMSPWALIASSQRCQFQRMWCYYAALSHLSLNSSIIVVVYNVSVPQPRPSRVLCLELVVADSESAALAFFLRLNTLTSFLLCFFLVSTHSRINNIVCTLHADLSVTLLDIHVCDPSHAVWNVYCFNGVCQSVADFLRDTEPNPA